MRILVLSDSHGDYFSMKKAIDAQSSAEVVVFLGDGHIDFERCKPLLEGKRIYAVKGNNDFHCDYPKNAIINEGGIKIYITHGQYEYVKSSLGRLISVAKENECHLALYGHTHMQQEDSCDNVKLFCPGALRSDEYGVIDIVDGGFICIGIKLK
ncbi:MAG: YfcE family phosphodiesterase [Clostridia bacterium]|nr:YfcE family phosphodiesterase [Clostridia bacterium]